MLHIIDYVILLALAVCLLAAGRYLWKNGSGCSSCSGAAHCCKCAKKNKFFKKEAE
ncbi:MAG: hypothetical protein ACI3ZR_06235 [bacterium]